MGIKEEVQDRNQQGITLLMAGDTDNALELFREALELAARDDELQAQCLINIGDWHRRVSGDTEKARELFSLVWTLTTSSITRSRLRIAQAMAEEGERRIGFLKEAIQLAQDGYQEDAAAARRAKFFALHRLCGFIGEEGSDKQKQEVLQLIEESLPELPTDDAEVARLNYTRALIIAPQRPTEAITLLEQSAKRLWTESPLDAGPYLIYAARIAVDCGDVRKACELIPQAEEFSSALNQSASGRKYLAMLNEVKSKLN